MEEPIRKASLNAGTTIETVGCSLEADTSERLSAALSDAAIRVAYCIIGILRPMRSTLHASVLRSLALPAEPGGSREREALELA